MNFIAWALVPLAVFLLAVAGETKGWLTRRETVIGFLFFAVGVIVTDLANIIGSLS